MRLCRDPSPRLALELDGGGSILGLQACRVFEGWCPVPIVCRGLKAIARRPHHAPPVRDTGPRVNDRIRATEIRLIDHEGENQGVVTPQDAIRMAEAVGLDLVEISPTAKPPVCKIMDFGKFKYEQQKKAVEAKKHQNVIEIKEVKFRPNIDIHDYGVKMRNVFRFLESGDKVKVTLRFRGREMAHQELGRDLLKRIADDTVDLGKVESMPKMEGRQMIMVIGPKAT
ncbi:MAG: translation initiation factor IF-3 [Paracoccaceae bacterium]